MASTHLPLFQLLLLQLLIFVHAQYCGISLGTGHEGDAFLAPKTNIVLNQIRSNGANYVQFSAYVEQVGRAGAKVRNVTDDATLRSVIRRAKARGLKVFLKPVIEAVTPRRGGFIWRGDIPGTDRWFANVLTPFTLRMARLAADEGVDVLSVGSEYVASLRNTRQWIALIRKVRAVYKKGKLTYIANHDAYHLVKFFHLLDFISVSAYYRLRPTRRGPYPDLAGTKALYQKEVARLLAWRKRAGLQHKKILIAEFGIQSKGGGIGYFIPWEWRAKGPLDLDEQVKFYEAFFSTFASKPWSLGVMLWHFELDPQAGKKGYTRKGYTPQNKPALKVLRKYYRQLC